MTEALLGIPRVLAENGGFEAQECSIMLLEEHGKGHVVGLDVSTGGVMDPEAQGVYDNYCVKKQILQSAPVVAQNLLLVDEVIRAGVNMRQQQ